MQVGFAKSVRDRISQLKREYVKAYCDLHTRARLGPSDESKRSRITRDARLNTLRTLVTIELLDKNDLTDFQHDLTSLKECSKLAEVDLATGPTCPHCGFRPDAEMVDVSASQRLEQFDTRLDDIVIKWTQNLISNLTDPTVRESLDLLTQARQMVVEGFLKAGILPDPVEQTFIAAVSEALKGLQKIVLTTDQIRDALLAGGSPTGVEDLVSRFKAFLDDVTKGRDKSKVRVVIKTFAPNELAL
jgi:hypothetical protein